jgi:hypothetical protein
LGLPIKPMPVPQAHPSRNINAMDVHTGIETTGKLL